MSTDTVVDITDPDQVASARQRRDAKRAAALADAVAGSRGYSVVDTLTAVETVSGVPIHQLIPHPQNPRRDVGDIAELTADIAARGVDSPLTVVPLGALTGVDDRYQVVIGHRRLAAATAAGLERVPCIIRTDLSAAEQLGMMLRENVHRADLTAVEEADAIQGLLDLGLSVESVAHDVARSETTVRRRARLATAPEPARAAVHTGQATLEQWEQALTVAGEDVELLEKLAAVMHRKGEFEWQLQTVKEERKSRERLARDVAECEKAGVPAFAPEDVDEYGHPDHRAWRWAGDDKAARKEWGPHCRYQVRSGRLSVYRPNKPVDPQEQAKVEERRAQQAEREAAWDRDREKYNEAAQANATASELRIAFVSGYCSRKRVDHDQQAVIATFGTRLLAILALDGTEVDSETVIDALNLEEDLDEATEDEEATADEMGDALLDAATAAVDKMGGFRALLKLLSQAAETIFSPMDWKLHTYVSSRPVQAYYELLTALGYEPAPAERDALGWAPADSAER